MNSENFLHLTTYITTNLSLASALYCVCIYINVCVCRYMCVHVFIQTGT